MLRFALFGASGHPQEFPAVDLDDREDLSITERHELESALFEERWQYEQARYYQDWLGLYADRESAELAAQALVDGEEPLAWWHVVDLETGSDVASGSPGATGINVDPSPQPWPVLGSDRADAMHAEAMRTQEAAAADLMREREERQAWLAQHPRIIPAGARFLISHGEYSDYSVLAVVSALRDINIDAVYEHWETHVGEKRVADGKTREFAFVSWLQADGWIDPISTGLLEWTLSDDKDDMSLERWRDDDHPTEPAAENEGA